MLSDAATLAQLAQLAPWLAVGVLALVASAWVYRQSRRAVRAVQDLMQLSAARQGKRIGELEKTVGMLDLRRRQVEWTLLEEGLELPHWPADGPDQPRPRTRPRPTPPPPDVPDVDEDLADDDPRTTAAPYPLPVPPLPEGIGSRHRR